MSGTSIGKADPETMEARDLDRATVMLVSDFAMVFPGAAGFTQLADVLARAKPRCRRVEQRYERVDEMPENAGETIVLCCGTLDGEWPDFHPFDGIRFSDRFVIRSGKPADQLVRAGLTEIRSCGG